MGPNHTSISLVPVAAQNFPMGFRTWGLQNMGAGLTVLRRPTAFAEGKWVLSWTQKGTNSCVFLVLELPSYQLLASVIPLPDHLQE